jgi:hypothetical protein
MSISGFANLLASVDWETADQVDAKRIIERGLAGTGWALGSFALNRYTMPDGPAPSAAGLVTTGRECFRTPAVVQSLGRPFSLTLAPPLGFLDISTPESVDLNLRNGRGIGSVQYLLKPRQFYSFEFGSETGCLHRFDIGRK